MSQEKICTLCGFRTVELTAVEGKHPAACSLCALLTDYDTKTALLRISNILLRELVEVRSIAKTALQKLERLEKREGRP